MTPEKRDAESVQLIGDIEFILRDRYGKILDLRKLENLIVNVGKAQIAGLINGVITSVFKYIAIGTGGGGPAVGDTALTTEIAGAGGGARTLGSVDRITTTVTNDTARIIVNFSFTASYAITESGLFDAATAGNLAARQVFAAINVVSTNTLEVKWQIKAS